LTEQLIDQRRLAVVDVRNDGDVTDLIHSRDASSGGRSVEYRRRLGGSQTPAAKNEISNGQRND
jgi:hypothetical protein